MYVCIIKYIFYTIHTKLKESLESKLLVLYFKLMVLKFFEKRRLRQTYSISDIDKFLRSRDQICSKMRECNDDI